MTIHFWQRAYPSANSVLVAGPCPMLVDAGFGSDAPAMRRWLAEHGVAPEALTWLVNTHWHCDHSGGNFALQHGHGVRIAASAVEAGPVNRRDADACRATWLHQPIEPYRVDRVLEDGDEIGADGDRWLVVATPGHTPGHISLHSAVRRVLILGDVLHDADFGWVCPLREGADALERQADSLARLEGLRAVAGFSGHGPAIMDLPAAFGRAQTRLERWRREPEQMAWHALKRIFSHALILADGVAAADLAPLLLGCPWFGDHARLVFGTEPADFVDVLLREALWAKAVRWAEERLYATAEYVPPRPGWAMAATHPAGWPDNQGR